MRSPVPPLCYTVQEVATLLRVDPDDIQALIARGALSATMVSGHRRIPAQALARYLTPAQAPRAAGLSARLKWAVAAAVCLGALAEGAHVLAEIGTPGNDSTGIPYEGFLERDGAPLAGPVSVRVSVLASDIAGATPIYEETQDITAAAGRIGMTIGVGTRTAGSATPFNAAVGAQDALFLALAVKTANDADYVPLAGTQRLGSAAYALRAAPGHSFRADSFHTNGLGAGQLFMDGARIDANRSIAVGTGATAGTGVVDVDFGGDVRAAGSLTCGAASVTGTVTASGVRTTQASAATPANLNTLWRNNLPKAWVNFTGSGAVQAAYNVSSVTRNGTGDYTIHFATALADANYAAMLTAQRNNVNSDFRAVPYTTAPATTTSFRLQTGPSSVVAAEDAAVVHAVFFGN